MEAYQKLEEEYASFTGSTHAVSCNSGTSALHLALLAAGIGKGDEVIVPDFTMAACAFAVSYTGATPVFGDVDFETYGLMASEFYRLVTKKTKAVILVHTYGRIAKDTSDIIAFAKARGIVVIEDACEAQGAIWKSEADMTCYSFYRNKIIAGEEGGMVTTENRAFAATMRYLKNMAFNEAHNYFHSNIGYNYRMPNAQAILALQSLYHYPENLEKRKKIEISYDAHFANTTPKRDAVWFYEISITHARGDIMRDVPGARLPFQPLSSFPMYGGNEGLPHSRELANSLVLLPVHVSMTHEDVKAICEKL